jgi:hypothetical protein
VVAEHVPATTAVIETAGDGQCVLTTGAGSLDAIIMHLTELDIPFVPLDPPELRTRCALLSKRLSAAAEATPETA